MKKKSNSTKYDLENTTIYGAFTKTHADVYISNS